MVSYAGHAIFRTVLLATAYDKLVYNVPRSLAMIPPPTVAESSTIWNFLELRSVRFYYLFELQTCW